MNKRGFTLVELLGVLVILAVIVALVFPSVSSVLKKTKETVYNVELKKILDATYDYTLKNTSILPNINETKYITFGQLLKERLIDCNLKNPLTGDLYSDDLVISIKNVKNNYKLESSEESMLKGDYLYTIEFDFMNSDDFINKKPIIKFEGYDISPIVININVGDDYIPLIYSAVSSDNKTLANKVIENIKYKSNVVNKINTYDAGIYYINYSVIDEFGYSTNEIVSLIILDDEKPNLVIPDNVTISRDVNTYDLMEGSSCTDNSGKCDIEISGNINFNKVGKYIIEYKALDPTGNTTILKRVITIE